MADSKIPNKIIVTPPHTRQKTPPLTRATGKNWRKLAENQGKRAKMG